MRGMRSIHRAGLVGEVGVSNYSVQRWRTAEDALRSRVLSNQVEYILVNRSPERDLLPFAESHAHVIIAFSPLAQGLLSDRFHGTNQPVNRVRATSPLFRPENLERTNDLMAALREVADAHSATPAQIALAWTIRRHAVAAIPGASSVEQLESNVAAAEIELADDEYQALHTASPRLCPTAVPDASPHRNLSELKNSAKFALKHSAKGGWYVAKTAWHDYKLKHNPPSNAGTKKQVAGERPPGRDK